MKTETSNKDLGADFYDRMYKEHVLKNFEHKAVELGFYVGAYIDFVSQKDVTRLKMREVTLKKE